MRPFGFPGKASPPSATIDLDFSGVDLFAVTRAHRGRGFGSHTTAGSSGAPDHLGTRFSQPDSVTGEGVFVSPRTM
jgi:hypothetical protein